MLICGIFIDFNGNFDAIEKKNWKTIRIYLEKSFVSNINSMKNPRKSLDTLWVNLFVLIMTSVKKSIDAKTKIPNITTCCNS